MDFIYKQKIIINQIKKSKKKNKEMQFIILSVIFVKEIFQSATLCFCSF